ncbi:MAG TPA: polysaccharide deacetylase [Fibrobacteria bacterium]|nr:polysaccharide deacetylase [Fibrobacteria bacterium]HOX51294.1 polysaccharide deacetylase [Fibrobacteria bacterium]
MLVSNGVVRRVFAILAVGVSVCGAWDPQGLRVDLGIVDSAGTRLVRLRSFQEPTGKTWMVALDPMCLETSVRAQAGWTVLQDSLSRLDSTTWQTLRREEQARDWKRGGVSRLWGTGRGVALTIDLCPSHKPFDRRVVAGLRKAFGSVGTPIPVSFALTGSWMRNHEKDLAWLRSLADSGILEPTWINHTDNHRYHKGLADAKNFLLLPGTDVEAEILGAESEMLRHGLVPSVYFRFPGLVDSKPLFEQVAKTGLLPVGADAWLAKDQKPGPGSIVLIHGNGNEPKGVRDFLQLLRGKKPGIRQGTWRLEDLRRG